MSGFPKDGLARNFLAGRWAEGDGGAVIAIEDPGTQEHLADCACAQEQSLAHALAAARASFERGDLADMGPADRAALLRRIAAEIRAIAGEGAGILCRESGKTLSAAQVDPAWPRLRRLHRVRAVRRLGPDRAVELPGLYRGAFAGAGPGRG
jgi:aldehyde dehydrogenase (NAD+)